MIGINFVGFYKQGSGIHIKKENRGKFTDYCGGKVTSECIAKGKNSKDPKIRKRATFADNARRWKHKEGGIIKGQKELLEQKKLLHHLLFLTQKPLDLLEIWRTLKERE